LWRWSNFVVKHRKLLLIIASILLIPAFIGYLQTQINYDVTTYLPDHLSSKQGQDILENEFHIAANVFVMVEAGGLEVRIEETECLGRGRW
jgi:uncharacterized membrane protein YdfJ with MMPL/SSD domain